MTANDVTRLLQHYVDNFRVLPWRSPPGGPPMDPYKVWLSEVMLQQTTVATVVPRFERFVERWPTLDTLAAASDEDILGEWAGLGYYARARNLIACAREASASGGLPRTVDALRQLPGIGAYTAGAIAAIAFGERAAAVDTNVARVIARLDGLPQPSPREIEARLLAVMPADRPGDLIQALMDLGATICTPRRPRCGECPLAASCAALASGTPEQFPLLKPKKQRPQRVGIAWWTELDGAVWLVRRPASGLLGGMAALPGTEWTEDDDVPPGAIATIRHVLTHFALDLAVVVAAEPAGDGWWQPLDRIEEAGLPTLYRRAVDAVLARRSELPFVHGAGHLEEAQGGP